MRAQGWRPHRCKCKEMNGRSTDNAGNARRKDGRRRGARSQAGWMGGEVVNGGGRGAGVCWRSVFALYRRVSFLFRHSEERETHRAGAAAVVEARANEMAKNGQLWLVERGPERALSSARPGLLTAAQQKWVDRGTLRKSKRSTRAGRKGKEDAIGKMQGLLVLYLFGVRTRWRYAC